MTGYNLDLFVDLVSEELICVICHDVLRDPVEFDECQHSYCRACITQSLSAKAECPKCRAYRTIFDLKDMTIIVRNLIGELKMRCKYRKLTD